MPNANKATVPPARDAVRGGYIIKALKKIGATLRQCREKLVFWVA
jgi:hypothetical protein